MAHLIRIRLKNFGPFRGEHQLELGPGCYGVFARHVDNASRSNGLGKSFFLGGIRWCLEGKKIEGVDSLDELISEGEDEMEVELAFSNSLVATRTKKRSKSTAFVVTSLATMARGEEGQDYLDRVLGIYMEERLSTSWAVQKELDVLTRDSMTSGLLTAMVEHWLGHEIMKLAEAEDVVTNLYSDAVNDHEEAVRELDAVVDAESKIIDARANYDLEQFEYAEEMSTYEERKKEYAKFNDRVRLRNQLRAVEEIRKELAELEKKKFGKEDSEELRKAATGARAVATKKSTEMKTAAFEVSRLANLARGEFDGTCPVSVGFFCPARDLINNRSKENQKLLEKMQITHRDLKAEFVRLDAEAVAASDKVVRARVEEDARLVNAQRVEHLRKRIEELEVDLKTAKKKGLEPLAEDDVEPLEPRHPDMERVTRAKLEVEMIERAIALRPDAEKRVKETAGAVRAYKLSCDILGPTMARRVLTERSVKKITADANARLHEAGVSLVVKDAWGRETGVLAEQCSACGEAFPKSAKVKACERCGAPRGNKIEHEFKWKLSFRGGAAKDLGGLGLRIAGHNWLRTKRGAAWSIAVLDEPTAQMDRAHRQSVAAAIRKLLVGSFEQAFITAHDSSTLESCDKKIFIEGHGSEPVRSTIKVV